MIIGLPLIAFFYAKYCNNDGWPVKGLELKDLSFQRIFDDMKDSWDGEVFLIYCGYWFY